MATTIGSAYVQILPSMEGISARLTEGLNGPAAEAGKESGEKAGSGFSAALGKAAKIGAATVKAAIATASVAVGATVKGITDLTKSAVDGFAEYEQLVGGVETLFGSGGLGIEEYAKSVGSKVDEISGKYSQLERAQKVVLNNANQAYKTAGLSANEYMETVTGMSASLVQSLGGDTQLAAIYADTAIRDMSDNANKMGSSMESIQNAYSGFAKGNYTMLDNLKLGYGGTASEMKRLIEDAEKLSDSFTAARDENGGLAMSYADVVDAIHIVQENMGIAGTTAKEASSTIEGSLGMLQASWQNLVTGLGRDDVDLGGLIDNVISSAETALDNILPVIDRVLSNIGDALPRVIPIISEALPRVIETIIPILTDNLPVIMDGIMQLVSAVVEQLPTLITLLVPAIVQLAVQIIAVLIENLPEILMALWDALVAVLDSFGILDWFNGVWEDIKGVFSAVGEWFSNIFHDAVNAVKGAWDGIKEFFSGIWDGIVGVFSAVGEWFSNTFHDAVEGIKSVWDGIKEFFSGIWDSITSVFSGAWDEFKNIGSDLINGLWEGIQEAWNWVKDKVTGIFDGLVSGTKQLLGIASPSKAFAEIGVNSAEGYGVGFVDEMEDVGKDMQRALNATVDDLKKSGIDWEQYDYTKWMSNGGIEGLFDEMLYNFEELKTSAEDLTDYIHSEYELTMSDAKKAVDTLYAKAASSSEIDVLNKTAEKVADLLEAEEEIISSTKSSTKVKAAGSNHRGLFGVEEAGTTITNTITINVHPSEGMDENSLAAMVERKLMTALDRRQAAWA